MIFLCDLRAINLPYVLLLIFADPHIKITGLKDDVAAAKTKVMTILDTKVRQ